MAATRGSPDPPMPRSHAAPSSLSATQSRSPSTLSSSPSMTPTRPATSGADADLLRSLNNLSLSNPTSTLSPNSQPPGASPSAANSRAPSRASAASPNSLATLPTLAKLRTSPDSHLHTGSPRSPALRSVSSPHPPSRSRSATPTLLRKASMNSLHSASGLTTNTSAQRDYMRRTSSSLLTPSAAARMTTSPTSDPDRKPLPTENSVAKDFFRADLKSNHSPDSTRTSETVILLQNDVYGHRWERPNTTKSTLSTIVERPERIQAVTLGISLAYVHNGGRHQDGKNQINPELDPSTLQVPFQIVQTEKTLPLSAPAVANVHGAEWTKELQAMCEDAGAQLETGSLETKPLKAKRLRDGDEFHEGDLYLNRESLKALEAALGATVEAVDRVCSPDSPTKRAFVAVRPPGHHCSSDWPSGFCWVNNVHVGIMHAFMNHDLTHAAIIDFDLHHGDGSQALTVDHNVRRHNAKHQSSSWKKSAIGYFSIHDINSYPCENGDWDKVRNASICIENAHAQNIWNVHLGEWKNELEFWYLYRTRYLALLEKARAFLRREADKAKANGQEPKAAIFLSAGFDASEYEMPGMQRHGVSVPTEFYARWTRDVVKMSVEEGLAVDGRVISCLEGGYSDRALYSGTFAHLSGLVGSEVRAKSDSNGVRSRRSTTSSSDSEARIRNSGFPYDPTWWAPSELDTLEAIKAMPTPTQRYTKNAAAPTYSSPTQASNARVSEYAKLRRSTSGVSPSYPIPHEYERGPTQLPTPPAVYWPTAALELTKLLVPSDRVTVSMTWDEVKEQDRRIKKDRSAASWTATDTTAPYANGLRKSTRERKPAQYFVPSEDSNGRSRRRTLAGASDLVTEKAAARGMPVNNGLSRHSSRRLSTVSMAMTEIPSAPAVPPFPPSFPTDYDDIRPESSLSVRTAPIRPPTKKGRPAGALGESTKQFSGPATKKFTKTTAAKPQTASKAKNHEFATAGRGSGRAGVDSSPAQKSDKDVGQVPRPGEAADVPSTAASDLDKNLSNITNGMKRIKINVVTKEMKAARAKAQKENGAPKSAEIGEMPPTPGDEKEVSRSLQNPLTSKTRNSMDAVPQTPGNQQKKDSGIFIAYQPEGPTPEPVATSGKTTWMPVNQISTPSPIKGHGFTSTSNIPFSAAPAKQVTQTPAVVQETPAAMASSTHETGIDEGREIPETPEHRL